MPEEPRETPAPDPPDPQEPAEPAEPAAGAPPGAGPGAGPSAGPGTEPPPATAGAEGALGRPSDDERIWAMVAHVVGVLSSLLIPIIVALVIYLTKKDESEFIADQAREALNFQITVAIASLVASLSILCAVGFVLVPLVWLGSLVFAILAAIKSYDGERYRYPYTLRLV